jgi:UDP-N-acetylmuramate dehydrogenase
MLLQENIPLKDYTSYKIGGPARYFVEAENVAEIKEALDFWKKENCPLIILGGGNNILFSDKGFSGLVLKISLKSMEAQDIEIRASSGVKFSDVVDVAAENSLRGLEWAGGLPGTVGGAVFGNAGAFGGEMKDSVVEVKSIDIRDPYVVITRSNSQCAFGYRTSIFKQIKNEIILEIVLRLEKGDKEGVAKLIKKHIAYRINKQPLDYPSAGSVFKNIKLEDVPEKIRGEFQEVVKTDPFPVVPVAYLLSEAGLKGSRSGGAMISEKHPNFIINTGGAFASDVLNLIELAKKTVREKFGIDLEEEIRIIDIKNGISFK